MRVSRVLAALVTTVAVLAGCGDDDGTSTASEPTDELAAGETAYVAHCSECHGTDLRGTDSGPSFLSIVYEPNHHPDDAFRSAPRAGVTAHHWTFGDMAPVPDVTDEELEAIIVFVRDAQEREGFEEYPPSS